MLDFNIAIHFVPRNFCYRMRLHQLRRHCSQQTYLCH